MAVRRSSTLMHSWPSYNNQCPCSRGYHEQNIQAQSIITFQFQESRSCSKSIRSPEHPCPKHNPVRVPTSYGHQSIHTQTIIPCMFQEHPCPNRTVTRACMPKPQFRACSQSTRSPEHPCPKHNPVRVPRAYGHQSIHAQTRSLLVPRHNSAEAPEFV